jgi:hypothetical protein
MLVHQMKRDVLSREAIVATLKGNEMIPDRRSDKQLVPQLPIFPVGAVQSVLVYLAYYSRMTHAFGAPAPEAVVGVEASTTNLFYTRSSLEHRHLFAFICRLKAAVFPRICYNGRVGYAEVERCETTTRSLPDGDSGLKPTVERRTPPNHVGYRLLPGAVNAGDTGIDRKAGSGWT